MKSWVLEYVCKASRGFRKYVEAHLFSESERLHRCTSQAQLHTLWLSICMTRTASLEMFNDATLTVHSYVHEKMCEAASFYDNGRCGRQTC